MFGIDIGSYSIKAAVVKKSGRGGATIEQVACAVLPEETRGGTMSADVASRLIADLVKKVGKGQDRVALSVPTSSVILKTINVDANLSESLLDGEIQMELVNFVPFPLEQVYSDYVSLGRSVEDPDKEEIFVVASRKDVVDKVAGYVNVKSIRKKEVEVESFALGQVVEQIKGKNYREAYAVVDIGYKSTVISIFKSGRMLFNREQQVGGYHLTEAIAEASGQSISEAEQVKLTNVHSVSSEVLEAYLDTLVEQIGLALEFFSSANSDSIENVYITGGGSLLPGLLSSLNESLSKYKMSLLPIGQEIKIGKKTNGLSNEEIQAYSAVVSGLAMRD